MNVTKAVSKRKILTIGAFLITVVAFQNCSSTNFASDESVLASKSVDDSGVNTEVQDGNGDGKEDIAQETPPTKDPSKDVPQKEDCDNKGKESKNNALVECELGVASSKIIIDEIFKIGSNASSTRVCMSQKACLEIINAYAGPRNCTLKLGDESGPATGASCTKIFPGSQGTCKNALVLSDAKVTEILQAMANQ